METEQTREDLGRRDKVRHYFIGPLVEAGMVRPRRMKAPEHEAFLHWIEDRLGYMTPDSLTRLRHLTASLAGGTRHDEWPSKQTIRQIAGRIETPPDQENKIMTSWLHSVRGPALLRDGGLVETYLFLRKENRPPLALEEKAIAEAAQANAGRLARISREAERGVASSEDLEWRAWYSRLSDICRAIVEAGEAHRAGAEGVR